MVTSLTRSGYNDDQQGEIQSLCEYQFQLKGLVWHEQDSKNGSDNDTGDVGDLWLFGARDVFWPGDRPEHSNEAGV